MNDPAAVALAYTIAFGLPVVLGIRATYRLWRIYLFDAESRSQVILLAFAVIATVITVAGAVFGGLALRRFLGFEALPFSAPLTIVLAAIILLIPAALERLVTYIGRGRDNGHRRRVGD